MYMAVLQVRFRSQVLKRSVSFYVCLPTDKGGSFGRVNPIDKKYPTLYLLHGLQCDAIDWLYRSNIEKISDTYNIAVVMPNAENSFYVNSGFINDDFESHIAKEIVEETRRMFPLSTQYEDTYIGGVSMGGFGAFRLGLKYANTFSKILSFSAAIHMFEFEPGDVRRQEIVDESKVFGDYYEAVKTDMNPSVCLDNLVKNKDLQLPKVYMICGKQDNLIDANRSFHQKLVNAGIDVIYEEHDGIHSFSYWNDHVEKMVSWLMK